MYIRVNEPVNEVKRVKITNALKGLGVNFDVFNSAERIVCQEEASDRVEAWEDVNLMHFGDDLREEIINHLEDRLYNDDYVINGEAINDITDEVMNEYENKPMKQAI